MSSADHSGGRVNQRSRTRTALLDAARRLLAAGGDPNVAEVADAAMVSRATAYRYFPDRETLLLEAGLDHAFATITPDGLEQVADPVERVAQVQQHLFGLVTAHEATYRRFLAATLQRALTTTGAEPARGGRRLAALELALAPVQERLGADAHARLVDALAVLCGGEAVVTLKDVCHRNETEAATILDWAVRALVDRALAEADAARPATGANEAA